jgi:hypothetical protein
LLTSNADIGFPIVFTNNFSAGTSDLYIDGISVSGPRLNPSTNTITAATFVGALSGNATTATTLQTARNINGVSFNGSADITVADSTKLPLAGGTMTGNVNFNTTDTGLVWSMNTDGAYIKFFNTGDGDTNSRLEYATVDNGDEYHRWMIHTSEAMNLKSAGLTIAGSATATGFFNSSDSRLKSVIKRDGDVAYYKWLDGRDDKEHIGYIAQEQQQIHPDQVGTDGEFLTVNYIEILVAKVRELEKEIELLKSKI